MPPTPPTIELLCFEGCANHVAALAALHDALRLAGISDAPVHTVWVESDEDAAQLAFYGSPTIRINGLDLVPPSPDAQLCLACRIYRAPDGRGQGYPPVEAILAALAPYTTHRRI